MVLSTQGHQMRGRIGAFTTHSLYDPKITTIPARQAFLQRFLDAIPADLPEEERLRRAQYALRAHMTRLALHSAQARRRRAQRENGGQNGGAP
jgi:hypothetical protein